MLEDFLLFERAIVVEERVDANLRLRVLPWRVGAAAADDDDGPAQGFTIAADEPAFTMSLDDNPDPTARHLRYAYTSMVAPVRVIDVDLARGERTVRRIEPVEGYRAERYATARLHVPARDGARVPVSIAWRRDPSDRPEAAPAGGATRTGGARSARGRSRVAARAALEVPATAAPAGIRALLMTAYGAYGDPFDPQFDPDLVSLLDRGFAVAIVHVRGGLELGEDWYDGGRLQAKPNTFADFVDATRWLVRRGWAPRDRVFAEGGSAGGLLVAAVANQAGSLYRGLLLQVPFVDVLTSMLDDTLPLTAQERCEWGDPRNADDFAAMRGWSPYDNLKPRDYPAMLVTAALHDAQVPVHEPAKYVAKLRALKTDANPLLLHVEFDAGHAGRIGRFERQRLRALEFAFLLDLAGLAEETP
jgi:oligopeptidase B